MNRFVLTSLFLSMLCRPLLAQHDERWLTRFERSGGEETPRYLETLQYCQALAEASPDAQLISFGKSAQGRALSVLILSGKKAFDPKARHDSIPTVLITCCIHPGESAGKDAALMLARDCLFSQTQPSLLDSVRILIIPIFNADGHERFGPYNRINQLGPREMGFRVTSTRLNLNRDFMKAETPEMRAWIDLFNRWDPDFVFDCHTTDGQDFQYAAAYYIDTHPEFGGKVSAWVRDDFLPPLKKQLENKDVPIIPYAGLLDPLQPAKGLLGGIWPPRLSNIYCTVRNRPGFLIEAHSLKPYSVRVHATYEILLSGLRLIRDQRDSLKQAIDKMRNQTARLGQMPYQSLPLRFKTRMDSGDSLLFRSFGFKVDTGMVSNQAYKVYNKTPVNIPTVYYNTVVPTLSVSAPRGYIVPVQWQTIIDIIQAHGIETQTLSQPLRGEFETYRFHDVRLPASSYEGHQRPSYSVTSVTRYRELPAGSAYIPLGHPDARLIMHLLEPQAPDALVKWGYMNTIFEHRVYFEDYVMEPMAEVMYNSDADLRQRYQKKLTTDSTFASSARARLEFFYQRTHYWDEEKNLYPIVRITDWDIEIPAETD